MRRAGSTLFVALVVASVVVAAVVVHARTPDLALQVTRFPHAIAPSGGKHDVAHIRFFVRESDSDATVEIVGPDLRPIRILYVGPLVANRPVSVRWNGRTDSGHVPNPRDRYRLRVVLPNQDRDMIYTRRIALRDSGQR